MINIPKKPRHRIIQATSELHKMVDRQGGISRDAAIAEAEKLKLMDNPYYYTLLGELYRDIDRSKALENLQKAHILARTQADKRVIEKAMQKMGK